MATLKQSGAKCTSGGRLASNLLPGICGSLPPRTAKLLHHDNVMTTEIKTCRNKIIIAEEDIIS